MKKYIIPALAGVALPFNIFPIELLAIARLNNKITVLANDRELISTLFILNTFIKIGCITFLLASLCDTFNNVAPINTIKGCLPYVIIPVSVKYIVASLVRVQYSKRFAMFSCMYLSLLVFNGLQDQPSREIFLSDPLKWGLGNFLLILLLYFFQKTQISAMRLVYGCLILLFPLLYVFVSDSRSSLLLWFVSVCGCGWSYYRKKTTNWISSCESRSKMLKQIFTMGAIIPFSLFMVFIAASSLSSGIFLKLAELQSNSRTISQAEFASDFLFVARPELLLNLRAFAEHTLTGIGSWSSINSYFDASSYQSFVSASLLGNHLSRTEVFPHSHLLQSLVWHGILTLPFWVYALGLIVLCAFNCTLQRSIYAFVLAITLLANIFFSPLGFINRYFFVVYISFLIATLVNPRSNSLSIKTCQKSEPFN